MFHIDRYGVAHTTMGCPEYAPRTPDLAAPPVPASFVKAHRVTICADCEPTEGL